MKQVLQDRRSGRTFVRDVPPPSCPPGGVLVRNAYSAISSGTERARVELSQKSLLGKARERPDLVRQVIDRARRDGLRATAQAVKQRLDEETPVGYSSAGVVVEVGEHARGLQVGDQVACAGGGHANHAELVAVPSNLCVRVPDGVTLQNASITTIAAIAMHGIRLADVRVGSRVAVIGCGLVGQIALRLLAAAGAQTFALDIDPDRVQQALETGADHGFVIDGSTAARLAAATDQAGVDEVLVTAAAGSSDPLVLAAQIARDRGTVVLVGSVPIEFPREPLYEKELDFRVSRSYGPGRYDPEYEERGLDYPLGYVRWTEQRNMEAVLALQAQGRVSFSDLVEVVPAEDAVQAYARLTGEDGRRPRGAIVLAYGEGDAPARDPVAPDALSTRIPVRATPKRATGAHVRVGLIGPGSFARRLLIPALEAAGAELVVVGGGSGPSASAAVRTGSFQRVVDEPDEVLGDPQVDAVVICTRHEMHAELSARSLVAGKHVFCEKPLALTAAELESVMAAAQEAEGILMVGFNRRFSPLLAQMRKFLAQGGGPMTLAYRVSAGQLPEDHWTHDLVQGGGRVLGEVCHFVDSLVFLTGSTVTEVYAAGHGPRSRPRQGHDNLIVNLRFADSSVGSIVYVADGSPKVDKERIEGFTGSRSAILEDYRALECFTSGGRERSRLRTQDKGHGQEMADFLDGARMGTAPIPLPQIDNVTAATLGIVESLRTGRPMLLHS
jgi:predicted dehydrogenase